jgi:ferredoxin-NADP reductase/MOSC domain-containing protein YiiM
MPTLLSVNVGLPKDVAWQGRTVHTGIWKSPVTGPRMVRRLNIDGDGQGDLNGHGGENRAVLVYQVESYAHWREHLGRPDLEYGSFGENFTVDGLPDDEVCIGDRYRIGEAEFEVTQPRVTCFRVGMRLGEPAMPSLLVSHHRPGFYLRVIAEGRVRPGDDVRRTRTGRHAISVADIDALLYLPGRDLDRLRDAVDIPALSPGWQQSFHELLDAAQAGRTAAPPPLGVEPAAWTGFRRLRVTGLVTESTTVTSVRLQSEDGTRLPAPRAGQFLTVRVPGAGHPAPVRSYSLSSDPAAGEYRISIKRESHGTVSAYLHTHLEPGALIDVAAPRGSFVLIEGTNPVLLISAGIGVTPLMAMLHQLARINAARPVWWIHTAHDANHHAFAAEAHDLLTALQHTHEEIFYTAEGARLTAGALAALGLPAGATAYLCGPDAFMNDITSALTGLGIAPARIHTERFGTLSPINPGVVPAARPAPHQPPGPAGAGPEVTFVRSGLTVRWPEGTPSLLDLAERCDVPTRWSCRTGVCHTCVTPVLGGTIEYATAPLELPAAEEALICCARPTADLVLDL